MADISKCHGTECSLKAKCYRYTAPANEYRQAYFAHPPCYMIQLEDSGAVMTCDYFMDNKDCHG
jgi:hypothetical protein